MPLLRYTKLDERARLEQGTDLSGTLLHDPACQSTPCRGGPSPRLHGALCLSCVLNLLLLLTGVAILAGPRDSPLGSCQSLRLFEGDDVVDQRL